MGLNYAPKDAVTYLSPGDVRDGAVKLVHDQEKFNLVWMVCPEIDEGTHQVRDAVLNCVHKNMDASTRRALGKAPAEFMAYWRAQFNHPAGDPVIVDEFPANFMTTMNARAAEAQRRIMGEPGIPRRVEGNVVYVTKWRKVA